MWHPLADGAGRLIHSFAPSRLDVDRFQCSFVLHRRLLVLRQRAFGLFQRAFESFWRAFHSLNRLLHFLKRLLHLSQQPFERL